MTCIKLKSTLITLLLLSFNAYSEVSCPVIPGSWKGIYTIKNQDMCKQFNGCQHLIRMSASHLSQANYTATLQYPIGALHETVSFTCENGVVSLPVPFDYEINTSCDSTNKCFINFSSEYFYAELTNG